jgi:hypothetical protein
MRGSKCVVRHIVAAGDPADWFAVAVAPADRLGLLVLGRFRFAAELDASGLCPLASLAGAGAGADPIAIELGEAAGHG